MRPIDSLSIVVRSPAENNGSHEALCSNHIYFIYRVRKLTFFGRRQLVTEIFFSCQKVLVKLFLCRETQPKIIGCHGLTGKIFAIDVIRSQISEHLWTLHRLNKYSWRKNTWASCAPNKCGGKPLKKHGSEALHCQFAVKHCGRFIIKGTGFILLKQRKVKKEVTNWRAALNFILINLAEIQSYCLCNYGMK